MDSPSKEPIQDGRVQGPQPTLTPRDYELIAAAWLSLPDDSPPINLEKFIKLIGFKNSHAATTSLGILKKKLKQISDDGQVLHFPMSSKVAKAAPRKRPANHSGDAAELSSGPKRSTKLIKREPLAEPDLTLAPESVENHWQEPDLTAEQKQMREDMALLAPLLEFGDDMAES